MLHAMGITVFVGTLLVSGSSWSAEVVVGHPATAAPGETVSINVFGDPMGALDIGYRIEMFVTDGDLSVLSTTTPAPFTPTQFTGTCGIVSSNGCIAADGISSPFANTFAATTLATLELDTTGVSPGTVIIVSVRTPGYSFFGSDEPLNTTVIVGSAAAVPSISPAGAVLLMLLLAGARYGIIVPRSNSSCQNEEGSMDSAAEQEPSVGLGLARPQCV